MLLLLTYFIPVDGYLLDITLLLICVFNKSAIAAFAETRIKLFFKFQVKKADNQFEKETRKLLREARIG